MSKQKTSNKVVILAEAIKIALENNPYKGIPLWDFKKEKLNGR